MIQSFVEGLIGPSGRQIVAWYMEHDLLINGIIVGLALLYILFPSSGRRLSGWLRTLYVRSPFAPDEKDRQAIDRMRARYKAGMSRGRRT